MIIRSNAGLYALIAGSVLIGTTANLAVGVHTRQVAQLQAKVAILKSQSAYLAQDYSNLLARFNAYTNSQATTTNLAAKAQVEASR